MRTAMNHLRLLGMGRSAAEILHSLVVDIPRRTPPPPPSAAASTQPFTPSRRDCTAHRSGCPATPSQQPPARLRLLVWAGLHNNSPPALQQPGHEPKDGVAQPPHGPGQGRRGGLLALPAPRSAAEHLRAVALTCSKAASGRRAATASHLCGRVLLFMLVFTVVSQ